MPDSTTKSLVRVDLFGTARLRCGTKQVWLDLPEACSEHDVAIALADACPDTVGTVVSESRTSLTEGYTLNLNGVQFLKGGPFEISRSDVILIFSSQAGG